MGSENITHEHITQYHDDSGVRTSQRPQLGTYVNLAKISITKYERIIGKNS